LAKWRASVLLRFPWSQGILQGNFSNFFEQREKSRGTFPDIRQLRGFPWLSEQGICREWSRLAFWSSLKVNQGGRRRLSSQVLLAQARREPRQLEDHHSADLTDCGGAPKRAYDRFPCPTLATG